MPRKPNYDFERKERERLKDMKKAKRAAEKQEARDRKAAQSDPAQEGDGLPPGSPTTE